MWWYYITCHGLVTGKKLSCWFIQSFVVVHGLNSCLTFFTFCSNCGLKFWQWSVFFPSTNQCSSILKQFCKRSARHRMEFLCDPSPASHESPSSNAAGLFWGAQWAAVEGTGKKVLFTGEDPVVDLQHYLVLLLKGVSLFVKRLRKGNLSFEDKFWLLLLTELSFTHPLHIVRKQLTLLNVHILNTAFHKTPLWLFFDHSFLTFLVLSPDTWTHEVLKSRYRLKLETPL